MNQRLRRWAIIAWGPCVAVLAFVCPAAGYIDGVHFTFTLWLAESAGFSPMEAYELAKHDWATDYDPATEPLNIGAGGVERRRLYHFVTPERLEELSQNARVCTADHITPSEFRAMGQWLHALEDSFAHEGYSPNIGHATANPNPDFPWHDPIKFLSMANAKFSALLLLHRTCLNRSTRSSLPERDSKLLTQWMEGEEALGRGSAGGRRRWVDLTKVLYDNRYHEFTVLRVSEAEAWLVARQAQQRSTMEAP